MEEKTKFVNEKPFESMITKEQRKCMMEEEIQNFICGWFLPEEDQPSFVKEHNIVTTLKERDGVFSIENPEFYRGYYLITGMNLEINMPDMLNEDYNISFNPVLRSRKMIVTDCRANNNLSIVLPGIVISITKELHQEWEEIEQVLRSSSLKGAFWASTTYGDQGVFYFKTGTALLLHDPSILGWNMFSKRYLSKVKGILKAAMKGCECKLIGPNSFVPLPVTLRHHRSGKSERIRLRRFYKTLSGFPN